MLLTKLREYSCRLDDLAPFGYDKTAIRWLIKVDAAGNFQGFVSSGSGKKNDRGKSFLAPVVLKSVNVKASLLVGNGEYVLGLARDPKKQQRVNACHEAFVEQVRDCANNTKNSQILSVLMFLESMRAASLELPENFDPSMNFTFMVEGILPIELPEIKAYWKRIRSGEAASDLSSQCLVCGLACVPTDRHPIKVKGIPGGQPSGMTIVSANAKAFESYGLEASLIAPVCQDCAEHYAKAANALREKEDSRLIVGPLLYLFWTRRETGFNIASLFSQPQPEQVKALLCSVAKGRRYDPDPNAFYATALSASGGRVVVRDWLETTVAEVKDHLASWFALQKITDWDGDEVRPFGLWELANSLIPVKGDIRRDLPPNTPRLLFKTALKGGILPSWMLFQAIKRNRVEQKIPESPRDAGLWRRRWSTRAALIKMIILSQQKTFQEDDMVRLDEENLHPAYLCGRLLAVLERIQMVAVSPKATLIDRFFGTASTAPASVFSRLIKGAQAHLGKLRSDRPGAFSALQGRLEAIMGNLSSFPKVLSLEEQGWFSLGYYHQRAWDRAQAKARKEDLADVPETDNSDTEQE